jgi:hypothetical protein
VIASRSIVAHDLVSLAWLLINWRQAPQRHKRFFTDPNTSKIMTNLVNRWVAGMLGGWKAGISAQTMERNELPEVWQDRTLAGACHLMGGPPEIKLLPAEKGISPDLLVALDSLVALPTLASAATSRVA